MLTKVCAKCKLELPANNEYFSKNKQSKYGLDVYCKECKSILKEVKYRKKDKYREARLLHISKLNELGIKTDDLKGEFKINDKTKLECLKGHIIENSIQNVVRTKGCARCITLKPYWEITSILKNENYTILTSEDDFKGSSKSKIHYICPKGHESHSVCSSVRAGNRCVKCSYDTLSKIHRRDFNDVINYIRQNNYTFVKLVDEYENGDSRIIVICNNNHEYDTSIKNFYNSNRCNICGLDSIRGENHYSWKGSSETLIYLRRTIKTWKSESLKNKNYKCELSGNKNLEIHHKYSFHKIVEEFFNYYNIKFEDTIDKYSDEVITIITNKFNDFHNSYGLGACLTVDLHKLFHTTYGIKNNTPEQFEEFKQNYLNGKYDDVLPENLKSTSTQK